MSADCIFCKILHQEIPAPIIAENEDVFVIKDIAPKAPIHYLIIPKKHVQDVQALSSTDQSLAGSLVMMAQKLSAALPTPGAFRLQVNSGADAGQKVFHLHVHFLAGTITSDF